MYIKDDICSAGTAEREIRVRTAKPLPGGMLLVTFVSGEQKLFDTAILKGGAFVPLKDEAVFRDITIFHGIITWQDGRIDIAPEYVYEHGIEYSAPLDPEELAG